MSQIEFDKAFSSPRRGISGPSPRPRSNFFPSAELGRHMKANGVEEDDPWREDHETLLLRNSSGHSESPLASISSEWMPSRGLVSTSAMPVSRFSRIFGEGESRGSYTAPVSARGTPSRLIHQHEHEKGRMDFGEDLSEKLNKVMLSSTPNSPALIGTGGWKSVMPVPLRSNSRGKSSIWNDSETKMPLRCSSRNSEHSFSFEPFMGDRSGESFDILASKPFGIVPSGSKMTKETSDFPTERHTLHSPVFTDFGLDTLPDEANSTAISLQGGSSIASIPRVRSHPGETSSSLSTKGVRIKLPKSTSIRPRPGLFQQKAKQSVKYGQDYSTTFYRRNSHGYMFIKEPATTLRVSSVGSKSWVYIKINLSPPPFADESHKVKVYTSDIPVWHPMPPTTAPKHTARTRQTKPRRHPLSRQSSISRHSAP